MPLKGGISFRQYRTIDLLCFTVILCFSECLIVKACSSWFADQLYVVSPVAAVVAIVMMRWGPFAAVQAVVGGAVYCLISGGGWQQLLVYGIGNLGGLAALSFFRWKPKEDLRGSVSATLWFAAAAQAGMLLGRALMALCVGLGGEAALGFITTDVLSFVFTLVILWVARKVNGLFEDQKHYLFRIQRESAEEAESKAVLSEISSSDGESIGRGSHS